MIPYLIESEMQYRKDRTRKGIAASRSGRSRSSWRAPRGGGGEVGLRPTLRPVAMTQTEINATLSALGTMMEPVAAHTSRTLVGRDTELDQLCDLLGIRERLDRPGVVLLSGDAGVGKTRLLMELRDRAQDEGWQVVAGHCLDFGDSALPYLPFSELLGRFDTELPDVVEQVSARHPAIGRLQPGRRVRTSADAPSDGEPGADRGELFEAVHALIDAAAEAAPLLIVIEDTHWADQSTRDLLGFLFTRTFTHQVALVASYRSDDLHRRHPLRRQVAEWSRLQTVDRLALSPLPDDAVRKLIAELAPELLGERELAEIIGRAEGNAFFVEELVASGAGAWVPDDLASLLLVRLDRLSDEARQVVRIASVAGRKVTHSLLEAAAGLPATDLDAGIRQAVEMNVLVAGSKTYSFRHALLGEAVYDDLLPGERVRLHGQYVAALAAGDGRGTAAEMARHARRGMDFDRAARRHRSRRRSRVRRRTRRGRPALRARARAARGLRPGRAPRPRRHQGGRQGRRRPQRGR